MTKEQTLIYNEKCIATEKRFGKIRKKSVFKVFI